MSFGSCFESANIEDALLTWEQGGLVAIPTETVYGLGAPINNIDLVKKIFSYKERPLYDPLIVHVSDIAQAKSCTRYWNSLATSLAEKFWPGPLTIVLPRSEKIDPLITSGLDTVGIRCPRNQKTLSLIKKIGVGVAAPSANKFTKTSPTKKEHVLENFRGESLCILTSDELCEVGIESTIVRIEDDNSLLILRPGILTKEDLSSAVPGTLIKEGVTAREEKEAVTAPGQDKIHYRPSYPLFFCFGDISVSENIEKVFLGEDPYIAARVLYSEMLLPLNKNFKGRVFILPKEKGTNSKEQAVWDSLLNRLEKAASPYKA